MKYKQTEKFFSLPLRGNKTKRGIVQTFNAELHPNSAKRDVSWSHGFTHFIVVETGRISFCGINWFEENAKKVI